MKLVIAEKPSVGMSIAKVLGLRDRKNGYIEGKDYIVSWCYGHLVELVDAKDYNPAYEKWRIEDLPIIPEIWQYRVSEGKEEQFNVLKDLMNDPLVTSLVCATDAGREGEAIFRLLYEKAECKKPFERLWISSMEDSAILEGFRHLKNGSDYDGLAASAAGRNKADWLVGINATRLYSCLYRASLPLGRVQTPTLAMLVEREKRIASFVVEKSYSVRLNLGDFLAESESGLPDIADELKKKCLNQNAKVTDIEDQQKTVNAPKLYDLTTLQRDANRILGYTAQETLDTAQKLYEKKLMTYPRTDSQYITKDMETSTLDLFPLAFNFLSLGEALAFEPLISRCVNDSKVTDHHAILPTMQIAKLDVKALDVKEHALLLLIVQRFILAAAPKHLYNRTVATLDCENQLFYAKGKAILQEGWKSIEAFFKTDSDMSEDSEDAELSGILPVLQVGQSFIVRDAETIEHNTTSPKHFTEDTLLSAMETAGNDELDKSLDTEKKGIGTPATRAAIIERLISSKLVERSKKQLLPTEKGYKLIEIVPAVMQSAKMTAQWENQLTEIAIGKRDINTFEQSIVSLVNLIMGEKNKTHDPSKFYDDSRNSDREIIGKCPRCSSDIFENKTNFRCSSADCSFALWKDNRFFTDKKKTMTKTAAKSFLKTGSAKIKGFTSAKTGNKYDATVIMDDTGGKYVNFKLQFD